MKTESELTKSAFIKLNCLMLIRSWVFIVTIVLATAVLIAEAIIFGPMLPFVIAFIVFLLIYYPLRILYLARTAQNRNLFLPRTYTLSEDGMQASSSLVEETVKWQMFVKWKRVGGIYLLYTSGMGFLPVEKSAIPEGRADEFEALLDSKIPRKKMKPVPPPNPD